MAFSLGDSFELVPVQALPKWHDDLQRVVCQARKDYPNTLLHVTGSFSGDWHALDVSRLTPEGDCPVRHYDHETFECVREWPCIGAFVEEIALKAGSDRC
jgi:hypothetical protein